MVIVQPPLNSMGKNTMPLAWLISPKCSSLALRAGTGSSIARCRSLEAMKLSTLYMTAFGAPVVPPVKRRIMQSFRSSWTTSGLASLTPSSSDQKYRTSG